MRRETGGARRALASAWIAAGLLAAIFGIVFLTGSAVGAQGTPAPTPGVGGNLLFQDDFETFSNRWSLQDTPKGSIGYSRGALDLRAVSPGVDLWSVPDFSLPLEAYRIEVVTLYHEGGPAARFGLVLRYRDDRDFYAFVISAEGTWQVLRREDLRFREMTPADAAPLALAPGDTVRQLAAEVSPQRITFYANGTLLGTLTPEDDLTLGQFGVIALPGRNYIDVSFDDMMVRDLTGSVRTGEP